MNQYIITEEERKKMLKLWSVIQQHIDWQHNACHTLDLTVQEAYNLMENVRSHPYQSKQGKVLDDIPDVLVCQSLPNEHGFCGKNDCFCKELQRVESGDICKWMQENRLHQSKQDGEQG